jgi:hypothetical protein
VSWVEVVWPDLPVLSYDDLDPWTEQGTGTMAAPIFKVTHIDGTEEEVALRPRAQIAYEEETGDALISLDSDEMRVSKLYKLAWFAAGRPSDFDEWIDSLDSVEMATTGTEDEPQEEGEDTRPT